MILSIKASPFGADQDVFYMRKALEQAHGAEREQEVPIGAIVVDEQGVILAQAHNQVERKKMPTAHAEICAIEQACKQREDWRLEGCWVYVTLEPCMMCMGLIMISRCSGIVYGASSPLFGYRFYHWYFPLHKKGVLPLVSGVAADESATLLKRFFQQKRMDNYR